MKKIFILGGGAWGTALAKIASSGFEEVMLWTYEEELAKEINKSHTNSMYMAGFALPQNIKATHNVVDAEGYDTILISNPVQLIRSVLEGNEEIFKNKQVLIASKGIEISSSKFPSEFVKEITGLEKIGVLSGASFAEEVMEDKFTSLVCAHDDIEFAKAFSKQMSSEYVLIEPSSDVAGAEIGGAIKNIIAIGAGIIEGLGMGQNTRAYIISKGFREIYEFSKDKGCKMETLFGISVLGDLILTADSSKSRNYQMGLAIGKAGLYSEELIKKVGGVVEGFYTVKIMQEIAKKNGYKMPVCNFVYEICFNNVPAKKAFQSLAK